MRARFLGKLRLALVGLSLAVVSSAEPPPTPTFGEWKGFLPGSYVTEKQTYRGVSFRKDGAEYRRTVLLSVSEAGAATYFDYTAATPDGPWTLGIGTHGDVPEERPGVHVEAKDLPPENITVGSESLPCRVVLTVISDDFGTRTRGQWMDQKSGLELKRDETFDGQDVRGHHSTSSMSITSSAIEMLTIGGQELRCFVQQRRQSFGSEERRWDQLVNATIPGHRVTAKSWDKNQPLPNLEIELVAWGQNLALLADFTKQHPELIPGEAQRRREEEQKQEAQEVSDLKAQTLADLKSPDEQKRRSAVNSLGGWPISKANEPAVAAGLSSAMDDPDLMVRRGAALEAARHGVTGISAKIIELLEKDPQGAYELLEALGRQGDASALEVLLRYITNANQIFREAAAQALGNFKTEEARAALERALHDSDYGTRWHVIEALEKIGDSRSVPALLAALQDENRLVVHAAIQAVAKLGDDAAAPPMLELLRSGDPEIRQIVGLYIGQMRLTDSHAAGDLLMQMLDDPSVELRSAAIMGLANLRDKRAIPKLARIAEESAKVPANDLNSYMMVHGAVHALGETRDPAATPYLIQMLDVAHLNDSACEALGRLGDPAAAKPVFEHYLHTADLDNQRRARFKEIKVVGEIGTSETVAMLREYLPRCPPLEKPRVREAIEKIEQRTGQ